MLFNISKQGYRSLLSIGGDNLQFYPNFALFSTLGDEPRLRFLSGKQIKWRPKKGLLQKWNTSTPNSGEDQKKGLFQKWNSFFPKFM